MSEATQPLTLAICVDDPVLADRLAAALADAPGIRLATSGSPADAEIVAGLRRHMSASEEALTPREAQVLALLAEGASNKVIALQLGISVHTAKFHVAAVIDKLDATGRTDAVAHAARRGVIRL